MKFAALVAAVLAAAAPLVHAQASCGHNDTIDSFAYRAADPGDQYHTPSGGLIGADGANLTILPAGGLQITAGFDNVLYSQGAELSTHPGTVATFNYWFIQFNPQICYDMSNAATLEFDVVIDPGVNFNITLTQKSADCLNRSIDSQYFLLSKYLTPNGQPQHLSIPLKDFSTNLLGQPYDFKHNKDLTFVNLTPQGGNIVLKNFVVTGSCNAPSASGTSSAAAPGASSSPKSSSASVSAGWSVVAGVASVAALFAAIF
ncbi:uncharacterized protein BJ171DRAFT_567264 [Polychytrium aggregatum]|uniref:uncharacterized protein n=1 Tax=Polychytrium aggregatum TaxID=110093 RepID=UPI0022FE9C20|nr:uncharacterized protein BJ171DRAFT_567264 [Polychytrium aggregatum]KAI9205470.1 hypothetical protein BJ171DRAFT_567264 [Polychytrium aggregatum]